MLKFCECVRMCVCVYRSYRSIGDETFIRAFETATLGYEEWTHEVCVCVFAVPPPYLLNSFIARLT